MKISFDREEYLSVSSVFENETLDDVGSELSEFNEDVEDMAYELAYTRYALAKTERQLAALKDAAVPVVKWWRSAPDGVPMREAATAFFGLMTRKEASLFDELARLRGEG